MTKIFSPVKLKALTTLLLVIFASLAAYSQESQPWSANTSPLPEPTGFVNDYAGVIDAGVKQQLETKLKNLKDATNVEIAVAVVKTTGDRQIFDYSLAVARGWKIGTKDDDNPSALLFVAIDDRKYFTQVSRDLEDELPDGVVGGLQRQFLVPEFRQGNYGKGISDTIDAYIAAIQNKGTGTTAPPPQKPTAGRQKSSSLSLSSIVCCGVIILVILLLIFSRSKRGRNDDDDDSGGGGAASALPWVIGSILAGSGSSSGSSSSGWGGSSGGGGSDWGGFGGGGDFGGGGGGGDW